MSLNHGKEGAFFEQAKAEWHITDIVGYSTIGLSIRIEEQPIISLRCHR